MSLHPLAPGLILATPPLGDPNFSRSVVLLGAHTDDGSLGWVVNGAQVAPVARLLRDAGIVPEDAPLPTTECYERSARVGGPVSPRSAWLLYLRHPRFEHDGEIVLTQRWCATGDRSVMDAIARGQGPDDFRVMLGYAGWGPGQLDNEIRSGAWMPAVIDEDTVFGSNNTATLWNRAYETIVGVSPFAFTSLKPGSA